MENKEIIKKMNIPRVDRWLSGFDPSALRRPEFFEKKGFPADFVYQFCKKHDWVLCRDGTVSCGILAVREVDFLRGLAGVLGVNPLLPMKSSPDRSPLARLKRHYLVVLTRVEHLRAARGFYAGQPSSGVPDSGMVGSAET